MSHLNRHRVIDVVAYAEPFLRREDGFTLMAPFHPLHPMRLMETVRVSSLRELKSFAPIGIDIASQNNAEPSVILYAVSELNIPKPDLTIRAETGDGLIFRIAATTTIPEDLAIVDGALDVIRGLVWRRVDAIEAILWFAIFDSASIYFTPPSPVRSFRELFALARTVLSRMAPYFEFQAMMRPIAYGAALLENAAGIAQNSNYTELQIASGPLELIPVSIENSVLPYEPVVVYPRSIISLCKRYIYETEFIERVVDISDDSNAQRITCERYMTPALPSIFHYNTGGSFVMPSVSMDASTAIQEISSTYGLDALNNLVSAITTN
jgi:hypothetical protein